MTLHVMGILALILYGLYCVGFVLEGLKSQGSMGLRVIGSAAEVSVFAVLVWVVFYS